MLNRVIIIGRLTKDPVLRYLPSGMQVVDFSVVYTRRYMVGQEWKEESHFFDVKAYGRLAEGLSTRISKGYTVVVEGRLVQDRWTDREGKPQSKVRILAESVRIIQKPRVEGPTEEIVLKGEEEIPEEIQGSPFTSEDDEIPF